MLHGSITIIFNGRISMKHLMQKTAQETYSDRIMKNVRQNLGLEEDDTSRDDYIMSLSPEDVFDRYCNWEGLINYGYTLWHVMEELQSFK